jgi:hypothetical protein
MLLSHIEDLAAIYLNTKIAINKKAPNIDAKIPIDSPMLSVTAKSLIGSHNPESMQSSLSS